MTGIWWWLVDRVSRALERNERDAVHGDLVELGETGAQALCDVLGLVVRRQAALWHDSRPWLVLVGLAAPLGLLVSLISSRVAGSSAIYPWMYFNNWDWAFLQQRAFWIVLGQTIAMLIPEIVVLICLSWTIGFALGALSRRTIPVSGALFCLALLFGEYVAVPWYTQLQLHIIGVPPLRHLEDSDPVSSLTFYKVIFPVLVQIVLVFLPALWGMYKGLGLAALPLLLRTILWASAIATMVVLVSGQAMFWTAVATHDMTLLQRGWRLPLLPFAIAAPIVYMIATASWRRWQRNLMRSAAVLLMVTFIASAADQLPVLHPARERKAAANFALQNASGKTIQLKNYRGKVVLLDFWATWCTGCKQEIPWFSDFQKTYGPKHFAVVGVSLDEDGWKALRPFLAEHDVPYQMLLGNESTAKQYGIESMPDTFLIDRKGRVAAAYIARLVDRDDVEAKIKTLLAEH